jgi:glycosyltransferase involved in cell wall biosynthesis
VSVNALPRIWYAGNFEWPAPLARSIQTVHTAHALSRAGAYSRLVTMKPRSPSPSLSDALATYGLEPHPRFTHQAVPVLRAFDSIRQLEIHKRLAITNFSYCGLAALLAFKASLRSKRRPDWIVARDPRVAWTFLRLRPALKVPVVYEVHELFGTRPRDNSSLNASEQWGVANRTRSLESHVLRGADKLITLTEACRALIIENHGIPPERIQVIPDGTVIPAVPRSHPPLDSRSVYYVGQLYPWKGVDTLVRAMAGVPNALLTIIGSGVMEAGIDRDRERLEALSTSLGLAERVRIEPFVPYREVAEKLSHANVAVVPLPDVLMSRYFTSPLKLFDYMAAGVPIVASDLPSIREVISPESNGLLVEPDNPEALAAGLSRVLDDGALSQRLAARARLDVEAYSWDARAKRMLEFLMSDGSSDA